MQLILFGTGPFAVPAFQALLDSSHQVLALVTRPIVDPGNRRKSAANPVREVGEAAAIEIMSPADINEEQAVQKLKQLAADLFVVCDYGQILSRECLAAARLGGINLHGSLLPKFRGAAPINWAIYHGDNVLGITVIHMSVHLDAGPSLVQAQLKIDSQDTAATVEPKLARLGVEPVLEAIDVLSQWDGHSPIGETQDRKLVTKAPRLKKSDGQINWTRSAVEIVNQVRAFQPWPGTFTHWHPHDRNPVRMIIHRATAVADAQKHARAPGEVLIADKQRLVIQTGDGGLSLDLIQPAGKRVMPIADFLRGHQPVEGDKFNAD